MKTLSINRAWSETAAFVRREGALLFPVALGLIALPSILFQWLTPQPAPGTTPQAGAWMLLVLPLLFLTLMGSLAISMLALRRESVVGAAIAAGARRTLPVFAAMALVGLLLALLLVPISILLVVTTSSAESATMRAVVVFMLMALLLGVRFLLVTPVAADAALGPIAILKRSWALTAGHFWRLLALLALVGLVLMVLSLAVTTVVGSIALLAGAEPAGIASLIAIVVLGLTNAIASVYLVVLTTNLYRQLSDNSTSGT